MIFLYIEALYEALVIDFLMFTSRLSVRQWSLILLWLHQGPLRGNDN